MDEAKLISALADGNIKALEKIMKKYSGYVCTVARNFSRGALSEEDIDEISVEVFYKLWNVRRNLDIKIGLSAYLSAAARNAVKNRFRDLPPPFEDITELDISSDFLVEDKAELSIMMELLNEGVEQLSPKDREIFLRFYLYGESSSQIAKAMNISESSVRTNLHRARAKLKKFMSERGYDHV
ncbi:MAG: sigma-70 family RNA polymerase sigma factor [Oscillospiraceae bacterium]|nr:sigma-70 family RNA polymerase sigma factor [Oscillospiraceae bacterium]